MDSIVTLRSVLKSQYHASLAMLRDAIERGKPYAKEEVLAYWNICDGAIDAAVDATIFRR